jgi:hypothetical protein
LAAMRCGRIIERVGHIRAYAAFAGQNAACRSAPPAGEIGSQRTRRWRQGDSNRWSLSQRESLFSRRKSGRRSIGGGLERRRPCSRGEAPSLRQRVSGAPIIRNGVVEGACGVSGGTAQQNEDRSRAGAAQL